MTEVDQDNAQLDRLIKNIATARAKHDNINASFFDVWSRELFSHATDPATRQWYDKVLPISMLGLEPLSAATTLAGLTSGAVVEVGTYVGGATVALGRGIKARSASDREKTCLICMEKGGSHLLGPCPSNDILADWRRNVRTLGIDQVTPLMIEGNYGEDAKVHDVERALSGRKIGLLMIDADGYVDWTLNLFARHLTENAILIIDDYALSSETDKGSLTQPVVDRLCKLGYLERWSVIKWTWIGSATKLTSKISFENTFVTLLKAPQKSGMRKMRASILRNLKFAPPYVVRLPDDLFPYSDDKTSGRSPLLFLEDGHLLGQAHHPLNQDGQIPGYAHSQDHLAFSTSDGSDPRTNGKMYEIVFNGRRTKMIVA